MALSLIWVSLELSTHSFQTNRLKIFLSPFQLVIEATVGIAVLVRCFVNKKNMEAEIVDRLGNGFSRAPFAAVVVGSILSNLFDFWILKLFSFSPLDHGC